MALQSGGLNSGGPGISLIPNIQEAEADSPLWVAGLTYIGFNYIENPVQTGLQSETLPVSKIRTQTFPNRARVRYYVLNHDLVNFSI